MSIGDTRLEIGHVLFIDIVGYSKLLVKQQSELLRELNEVVSGTNEFRQAESAGKLIRLPTGDGMALVFRTNTEAPAQCAMEIARALKNHPAIQLRMGIHSGPVNEVVDVNQRTNIAGAGINMAQRVMDCGDAGHILLSRHVAEDLEQDDRWRPLLHDLGEWEVKHGVRVGVTNLYSDEVGNPQLPKKFQALKRHRSHVRWAEAAMALLVVAALATALLVFLRKRPARSLATAVEKSIAVLPFENLSEEKANAFFTEGVQDQILADLAKIADLKVISRTSVMQYKSGAPRNLREIGQQLGVARIVEGSVQRAANRVRVTAQLIDARNHAHLWAQTYDRDLADVFVIQSEIAKSIADQLQAKLWPNEKAAIETRPTADVTAFDLYSRAKDLIQSTSFRAMARTNLEQAIDLLNLALVRDPSFSSRNASSLWRTINSTSLPDSTIPRHDSRKLRLRWKQLFDYAPTPEKCTWPGRNIFIAGISIMMEPWRSSKWPDALCQTIPECSSSQATSCAGRVNAKRPCSTSSARLRSIRAIFIRCSKSRSVIRICAVIPRRLQFLIAHLPSNRTIPRSSLSELRSIWTGKQIRARCIKRSKKFGQRIPPRFRV